MVINPSVVSGGGTLESVKIEIGSWDGGSISGTDEQGNNFTLDAYNAAEQSPISVLKNTMVFLTGDMMTFPDISGEVTRVYSGRQTALMFACYFINGNATIK